MISSIVLAMALGAQPAQKPPSLTERWQVRYESLVAAMKKKNTDAVIAFFHPDYSETADGVAYGIDHVREQLPTRMDLMAQYGQKPKVLGVKEVGFTSTVTVIMGFLTTRQENGKSAQYASTNTVRDVWLKVGKEWKLYRSEVASSSMTRDGKPFRPPGKSQ